MLLEITHLCKRFGRTTAVDDINLTVDPGEIVCLLGSSGCGKTTICQRLVVGLPRLKRSISMTTRPPRHNEADGEDYFFVSHLDFVKKRKQGEFLEWATNFGALYGTPKAYIKKVLTKGHNVL